MIDTEGAVLDAAPAAPSVPALPVFDITKPRLLNRVTIQLDRERELRLPFRSLRIFEQQTGLSAYDRVVHVPASDPDFKLDTLVALLWAALLDEDPSLTIEQVWEMPGLHFGNIHYIRHQLDECWGENMPPPDKDPAPNGRRPRG